MLKEKLFVRRALVSDAQNIARVGLDSARVEVREEPLDLPEDEYALIWAQRIKEGSHVTYLCCRKSGLLQREELCGYGSVEAPLKTGHVLTLYVSPKFMRRGIGSLLMQTIEKEVRNSGGSSLETDVQPRNVMAHNFYQKCGFVFTDRRRDELIVMRKELV